MPYATLQDLTDRYSEEELIERTDRAGAGTVDAAAIEAALEKATGLVDLHLRHRYRVPLADPIPQEIVEITCSLARHALWKDAASEAVEDGRDQAMSLLNKIADGRVSLALPPPAADERGIQFYAEPAPFTSSDLKSYTG